MALKAQAQFTNKYEAAYNSLQSNPYFNESDWRTIAMGNDASNLDMYIDALSKAKDFDKAKFDETYVTEFQDSDTRLAALYNEVYASRLANDDRYSVDVYKYDGTGNLLYDKDGNPKTESKVVSAYEYNKLIISQQNEARRRAHLTELADEAKNPSGWATAGALLVDVAYDGFLDFFNKTGALGKTLIDMARSDKTFANDWFTQWENNYKPILDRIVINGVKASDAMLDFEKDFTHLRDSDGNLTTFGRIATGVASTIGEMTAATITGGILAAPLSGAAAGVGTGAKVAKGAVNAIRTASYYAPLATYSMGEQYKEITANGYSIATSKMLTNQLWKTGLEIGIESGLGKIFGSTGLDKMLFGRTSKGVNKITKANTFKALAHFAGEAVQEGSEEFLQEFSGFLVDTAYSKLVDGSFKTEFSMQNLIDAAIIGAFVSATHSAVTVASTKGKTVKGPDSEIKLGKIASAYYNVSMATLLQDLENAQHSLDEVIDNRPVSEKLEALKNRKTNIESDIKSLNDKLSKIVSNNIDATSIQMAQNLASDIGKGYALNQSLELVRSKESMESMPETLLQKRESLQRSLMDVDNQIANAQNVRNAVESRYDVGVGESIVSMFQSVYAASRAIQSFAGIIGEERVTKAAEILGRIEKMGNEGKFDKTEVSKARDEMVKELRLTGVYVDRSFIASIADSGMTKIKKVFKRSDFEGKSGDVNYDRNDYEVAKNIMNSFANRKTVTITEDGDRCAVDDSGENIAIPSKEVKVGAAQILHDEAEQRLVTAILTRKFKGNVVDKVVSVYRSIYKPDATPTEAINSLIFDENFFLTMLTGETENKETSLKLADSDMFQFLSSLLDIEKAVIPNDIREGVYKTKIESVKKSMAKALTQYLKLQPFANVNLDILTKAQREEVLAVRESFELGNRIVLGTATTQDWDFIKRKVNLSNMSSNEKKDFINKLEKANQLTRRALLSYLDEKYRVAFYGAYDGKTYLPVNSLRNRAFNQLLYSTGQTVETLLNTHLPQNILDSIKKLYGGTEIKNLVKFFSDRLSSMTSGRYSLQIAEGNKSNAENGVFKSGNTVLRIVDNFSAIESIDVNELRSSKNKTNIRISGRHSKLVTELLNDSAKKDGAGYYNIDDVITNPSLLNSRIRKEIDSRYQEVSPDATYLYLKSYFARKGSVIPSLSANGEIVFVDLTDVEKLLSDDFSAEKVREVAKGKATVSDLLTKDFKTKLASEIKLVISDAPEFFIEFKVAGDSRGTKSYVIKLSERSLKNIDELKTEFAHEFQHFIQETNRLNSGADGDILSKMHKESSDKLVREVMKNVPSLFSNVDKKDFKKIRKIVNEFLYYASGEVAAYGAEASDILKSYPVLIQDVAGKTRLTTPWGSSYSLDPSNKKMMDDVDISDDAYLKAVKNDDQALLRKMVRKAATLAGFYSDELYHGTGNFVFTKFDPGFSQDSRTVFATDNELLAEQYANGAGKKRVFERGESMESVLSNLKNFLIKKGVGEVISNGYTGGIDSFVEDTFSDAVTEFSLGGVYHNLNMFDSISEKVKRDFEKELRKSVMLSMNDGVYGLYANLDNAAVVDAAEAFWDNVPYAGKYFTTFELANALFDKGKSVVIVKNVLDVDKRADGLSQYEDEETGEWVTVASDEFKSKFLSTVYMFSDPARQLRSSDLVTYDDDGKVIPLSKRFDLKEDDIRYDLAENQTEVEERSDIKLISSLPEKNVNVSVNEITRIINDCLALDEGYQIPTELKDAVIKTYETVYGDRGKIKFADQSDIKKLSTKKLEENQLIAGIYKTSEGILIDRDYAIRRIVRGNGSAVAKTILHEMIHSVTLSLVRDTVKLAGRDLDVYLEHNVEGIKIKALDDVHRAALSLIKIHYDLNKKHQNDKTKVTYYGMTNVDEFIAELINPNFREVLKKETLWDKLVNAILKLLGINFADKNVLDAAQKSLEDILSNPEKISAVVNESNRKFVAEDIVENEEVLNEEDAKKTGPHTRTKGRKERGYVSKKFAEGTPLEPYARKTISIPLQELIFNSENPEYKGMDKEFLSKIREGKISEADINEFIRNADSEKESDVVTFNLINKTFFKNRKIKSLQELEQLVYQKAANYYAIRRYLIESGQRVKLMDTSDPALYDFFLDEIQNNLSVKRKYSYLAKTYDQYGRISDKYLKLLYMQHFDGSVETAGYVASVAKVMGYTTIMAKPWKITGVFGAEDSLDREAGESKEGNTTRTLEEMVPDRYDAEEAQRFIDEEQIEQLISAMEQELYLEAAKLAKENKIQANTYTEFIAKKNAIRPNVEFAAQHDWATYVELLKKYLNISYEERMVNFMQSIASNLSIDDAAKDYDQVIDDRINAQKVLKGKFRLKKDIVSNIEHMCATIRRNLNAKERKLFLADNSDLFTEDLKVEPSLYKETLDAKHPNSSKTGFGVTRYFDESVLIDIERRVRQLSKDVRSGVYSSEMSLNYKKQLEKRINSYIKEILKLKKQGTKVVEKIRYVNVGGNEIGLNSFVDPPDVVKRFLDRALYTHTVTGKPAKTEVQELSGKDEYHIRMNYKEFLEINAETLNHLTQDEVEEIVSFYLSGARPATRNAMYSSIELWTLGYFIKMSGNPSAMFTLSDAQLDKIEKHLKDVVSDAGTVESVWKSVLKQIKPEETIHKAMLKACNIELSPATEGELIMAINSHDVKRIQKAKQRAYEEAVQRYKGRKRTIFDRLLRYERMAMLSGPGTWVRNLASNAAVSAGNSLSEIVAASGSKMSKVLASLFPQSKKSKKHNKLNQYKIIGTKVSSGYSHWIKSAVIDNGLLELIADGLVKYDPRQSAKHGVENQLTKLIVDKIESDLFNTASSSNKVAQFLQNRLRKVMSDRFFINRSFIRYLGKMLTEDRTDVSEGLTDEVMNTIADAYVMSLQDYMHTNSFFGKLEGTLRTYLHRRFNPTTADGIFFLYKQVFPFANASWNWFMEGLKYTPVGLAVGIKNFCRLENTVNRMEEARQKGEIVRSGRFAEYLAKRDIGKGAIGSVGLALGILLVALGKVSLDDDDEYKLCFDAKDGPIYIDFSDVFGTNGILLGMAIGQSFVDADGFNYDSFMKVFANSLNTMFLDSTFADMYNTFRYSDSFGDYLTTVPADIAGMFVPNFVKTLGNTFKKYNVTYSPGLMGKLERFSVQSFAPFSYLMPYAVNPYTGEPEVINEGWFGLNLINRYLPVKVKNYDFGDVEKTAVSLGVKKGQLSGKYKVNDVEIKLSSEEIEALNQFYGKLNSKELEDFMMNKTSHIVENSKGEREELTYRKMDDGQKKAVIERIMSNNGQLAKVYVLTSTGQYKYYANDSEYDDLRKAGVITNVYRKVGKYEGFVKN